jgi:hypothetical protein
MMNRFVFAACAIAAVAGSAIAGDISQVNGLQVNARVFNDFGSTNLTIDGVSRPSVETFARAGLGTYNVNEQFEAGSIGNFANKHVAYLSTDGGNTALGLSRVQGWQIDLDIRISAPFGSPRKEAGIRVENPRPGLGYTDEGLILVASDGEVAVFGGVMPFSGLGRNAYTLGQTAHLTFRFFAPGEVDPILGGYQLIFTDPIAGVADTGIKLWSATEPDGTTGFNEGTKLALIAQNQRNPFINDTSDITYSNITIVPAPAGAFVLGLAGLVATRRRR